MPQPHRLLPHREDWEELRKRKMIGTSIYPSLSEVRPKNSYRVRCLHCGKYRPTDIRKPCKECSRYLAIIRPVCPRCGNEKTIKMGTNVSGVQIWYCERCRRRFREYIARRLDYDEPGRGRRPHKVIVTIGACLKCGGVSELADGMCIDCYDNASYRQSIYYWRKVRGYCVRCGKELATKGIYCDKHHRYYQKRRMQLTRISTKEG